MGCFKSKPVAEIPKNALSLVESVLVEKKPSSGGHPTKGMWYYKVEAKYEMKAVIGKGSHSRVVRVENRATKQPYAIKIIDKINAGDMCQSELKVLSRVNHPNIIHLIEAFESVGKLYVVVELATGGELFERIIARVYFSETDAIKTLKMILDGVSYLHNLGIAHRDLKPENLLYYHPGSESRLLITDFGLSGFSREGFMNTVCGTPEYIAPEVLAKQPYTCQVDIWAVGVIAFILLSGTLPFDDDNRAQLYRAIVKGKYSYDNEHWRDVSQSSRDFVDSLLVVDPSKRLTAAQALRQSWMVDPPPSQSDSNSGSKDNNTCSQQHVSSNNNNSSSSAGSCRSGRSLKSLRCTGRHKGKRRVAQEDIDILHRDPEVQAELSSLASWSRSAGSEA